MQCGVDIKLDNRIFKYFKIASRYKIVLWKLYFLRVLMELKYRQHSLQIFFFKQENSYFTTLFQIEYENNVRFDNCAGKRGLWL